MWLNLKYAWRTAQRSPGVTLIILVLLALGTGSVTTIFNPIYSLVFATPPFPQPDRLVVINENIPLYNILTNEIEKNNTLEYLFSNLASYTIDQSIANLAYDSTEEYNKARYISVTEDFFGTLGVLPLYGYDFAHSGHGIVISNRFWRNELKGVDDVIGKPMRFGSSQSYITGVMPDTFDFPVGIDMWIFQGTGGYVGGERHFLGRLRPGISMEQAERELKTAKFESKPELNFGKGPVLQPLTTVFYGDRQPLLWMLGTTTALFLLLVCSGIMSIFITRGMRRKSEMAMRMSFGATRWKLVFQLVQETLPLIIIGTLAGVWLSEIAGAWLLSQYPTLKGGEVVAPVKMAFFAAMVLIVSIIGALIPAFYSSSVNLNTLLKSGVDSKRKFFSTHELLIGIQLGLTLTFLTGAGLLIRGMMFKVDFPIGWTPQKLFVIDAIPLSDPSLNMSERMTHNATLRQEFQHQLEIMPEVAAVGVLYPVPFSLEAVRLSRTTIPVFKNPNAKWNSENTDEISMPTTGYASPEVFKMLGIPLVNGRFFTPLDVANEINTTREIYVSGISANTSKAAIINQSLAKQFWPGENAVGKIIYNYDLVPCEVVGVVQDFYNVADNKIIAPAVYYPATTTSAAMGGYIVKLHSNSLLHSFQQSLTGLKTGLAYINMQSLNKLVSDSTADMRLLLQLLSSFALLGILVAGLGVYATAMLMAIARTKETGIRMALGAQTWNILWLALWRSIRVILIGLPLGILLAWILSRILSSFIFQLNANDPFVWIISSVLLICIVIAAALIPALRAIRVNPTDVLRNG